jgi:hypothetical protein
LPGMSISVTVRPGIWNREIDIGFLLVYCEGEVKIERSQVKYDQKFLKEIS